MSPRVLLRLGVRSLLLHKLRSSLSILGVVFGVAAVVAMSSVGEGARRESLEQIAGLGIDSVTARSRPPVAGSAGPGLSLRDAESAVSVVPGVVAVAPIREAALPVESGGRSTEAAVVGTTPALSLGGPPRPRERTLPHRPRRAGQEARGRAGSVGRAHRLSPGGAARRARARGRRLVPGGGSPRGPRLVADAVPAPSAPAT